MCGFIVSLFVSQLIISIFTLFSTSMDEAMAGLTFALREQNEEAIKIIRDSGLTIIPSPSGSDLEEFFQIHKHVAQTLTDKIYPKDILDRIYRFLKKAR